MERDWIPPDSSGAQGVGTDEDLDEREAAHPGFIGEFGEREAPAPRDSEETVEPGEETPH
ncbi:hypothetical protein J7643_04075 [bacterium]|nr:hypothetical protein [bacterium]